MSDENKMLLILNYWYFYKPNIDLFVKPAKNVFSTSFHVSAKNNSGITRKDETDVIPDIPFELELTNKTLRLIITKEDNKWYIKKVN